MIYTRGVNVIGPGVIDLQIVLDEYKSLEVNIMPVEVMAAKFMLPSEWWKR